MDAVIVGNSRSAVEAIKSFREFDQESSLTCISKEQYPAYHRPLIAEYLSGEKSYDDILYSSVEFYQEKNVRLLKGVAAVKLDVDHKKIVTDQNHSIPFDRLLIATGSKPAMPPIPGINLEGVSPFWTLEEARALSDRVPNAKKAVIIGAGLVGMSAIHALHERGLSITVVEMLNRVLSPCLDEKGSSILQQSMERQGIDLRLNKKVVEIKSQSNANEVSGVVLDDNTEIPCQIVVVSAGVRPNLDFLRESPLEIDQGIIVNEYLETNIPGIYAAGDVAQPYNLARDMSDIIANLHNASEQGRIAGSNLAGQKKQYKGGLAMTSMRYFGVSFVSMGILSASEPSHQEEFTINQQETIYRKIVTTRNVPIGAVFVGDIGQAGIVNWMIRDKISINNPRDVLERTLEFEKLRKTMMLENMEGPIQWKEAIGLDRPWRKDHERIPVGKEGPA